MEGVQVASMEGTCSRSPSPRRTTGRPSAAGTGRSRGCLQERLRCRLGIDAVPAGRVGNAPAQAPRPRAGQDRACQRRTGPSGPRSLRQAVSTPRTTRPSARVSQSARKPDLPARFRRTRWMDESDEDRSGAMPDGRSPEEARAVMVSIQRELGGVRSSRRSTTPISGGGRPSTPRGAGGVRVTASHRNP